MALFAQIHDGFVTQVLVINDSELDVDGVQSEAKGIDFLRSIFGSETTWVQTSQDGAPVGGPPVCDRGPYAGIGYSWDGDKFAEPQPIA